LAWISVGLGRDSSRNYGGQQRHRYSGRLSNASKVHLPFLSGLRTWRFRSSRFLTHLYRIFAYHNRAGHAFFALALILTPEDPMMPSVDFPAAQG
jgi:hypothetical protein